MLYSYEAKDRDGRTVTGSIEAEDERSAARQVHEIGYFLMRLAPMPGQPVRQQAVAAGYPGQQTPGRLNEQAPSSVPPYANHAPGTAPYDPASDGYAPAPEPRYDDPRPMTTGRWLMENIFLRLWTGVSAADLAMFYRSFATLIDAGVPLRQACDALSAQLTNVRLRQVIHRLWQVVEAGGTISDAFAQFPWLFRVDHLALIRAGETSGNIDRMFLRIAATLEMEDALKKNVIKEVTMPIVTFAGAFLLPPIYLVLVCGKLQAYIEQGVLPVAYVALGAFALWVLCKLAAHVKYATDTMVSYIPVIGTTVRMIAMSQFARTLSILYSAGVSVPTSVQCAAESCGNAYLGRRLMASIPMMESGYGVVDALSRTQSLPPLVMSMLGVGETTGSLDRMMDKVADYFEQESMVKLHQIMVALRVAATILIGIKVLMVLIQFYGGYASSVLGGSGNGPCGPGPMTGPLGHGGGITPDPGAGGGADPDGL